MLDAPNFGPQNRAYPRGQFLFCMGASCGVAPAGQQMMLDCPLFTVRWFDGRGAIADLLEIELGK